MNNYSQQIQHDPNNASLYKKRGLAHRELGQFDGAIADFSKPIELDPSNARLYNSRGMAYDSLGQDRRAIKDYSKAIKLDPTYATPYYNRANIRGPKMFRRIPVSRDLRKACAMATGKLKRAACYSVEMNC